MNHLNFKLSSFVIYVSSWPTSLSQSPALSRGSQQYAIQILFLRQLNRFVFIQTVSRTFQPQTLAQRTSCQL